MQENNKIHFILTGGTIDSKWVGKTDTVIPYEHSVIPEYISGLNLYTESHFTEVCMKDSRSLVPEDRENILRTIEESDCTKIIVTHGTYTMPDTARYLKANLKREDQTIILTGSMAPLKGFNSSDGPFSLGYALAKVQELEPGIYLAMNGRLFTPEEVAKDLSQGKFYSIFQDQQ